ncbi:hypothetical protein [Streptomyces sp. NPDC051079]|uniref:hypothetical protein n=1 Tax=Streptomyces sp. NPDC051079 TaxID=3155043 RepID=UPI0034507A30
MHSDIHLVLHTLNAAEHHEAATGTAPARPAGPTASIASLREQLGWKLVEFGLKLAVPHPRTACATA